MNEITPATAPVDVETLQVKINDKTSVYIKAIDKDVSLAAPVYAINWFNTRRLWLYNLYNIAAAGTAIRAGGRPLFKGRIIDVLLGDDEERREMLLIVSYPSVRHFMGMLESTWFKLVSVLRLLSVDKFTFGFTQRMSSGVETRDNNKHKVYAIHHYRAAEDLTHKLEALLESEKVEIYYAGKTSALLYSGDSQQATQQVPFLMSGLLLLRAENADQIRRLVLGDVYQAVVAQTESSFIATLDRTL